MAAVLVLASTGVYAEPRPVLPAGTEIRIPGSVPFVLDAEHKLIDAVMRDSIIAASRLAEQLAADLVECERSKLALIKPREVVSAWLTAIRYIAFGLALAGAFALGMAAGGD